MEGIGHLSITDLPTLVRQVILVPVEYSYKETRELSCGNELPNCSLDRSRWHWPCEENIL